MKLNGLIAMTALLLLAGGHSAEARPSDGSAWAHSYQEGSVASPRKKSKSVSHTQRGHRSYASRDGGSSGVGGRPAKWCGWWMRTQKGGGPQYNLAWNWRNYGSPTSPQVGAVVVWRHHVGMITGLAGNGQWIVTSGNDGGRVRSRARSVSGAVFRI